MISPKQRLLALRIAANLSCFQLTLMNPVHSQSGRLYSKESNVLAPYFFVKVDEAGNGHEVSHANELLVFVKWSLGLFNQHQVGTGGRGIPHEEPT